MALAARIPAIIPPPEAGPGALAHLHAYGELVARTVQAFGDETKASLWLSSPSPDFNGLAPLQVAESSHYDHAALDRLLEPVLLRIEHGIYT